MKLLKFISATLSAAIVALVFSAINAHPAVDRVCNYTVGSTTTATGFANCTEEIGDLATKAFAIAATVSGTNDIEVTSAPAVTTLTDGQMVVFTAANTITGAATFKLDGTTARSLYQLDGVTALGSGDIVAGARYILSYKASNTRWLLMGTPGTGAAPAAVPYLTVGNTSSLALERAITPDGTTITGTDGGANGSYGLSVTTNGIGNAQLRQGTATSVIGRSANSTGNVADIAASADGQFLQRSSAALTWAVPTATQITNTGAGNIAASTVQAAINELDTEKQPLDATLTAWAAFNTNGLLTQTSADTFTGRTLTGPAAGITVSNGNGVSGNPTLALANDLAALEGLASTGFAVRSGTDTWVQRSLTAPAAGLTISNNDGISGAPTFALANDLAAYEGLSTTGIVVRSATDTALTRSITGTANEITVANGDGVAGAPTLSLPTALTFTGKTVTGGTFSGPGITTPGAGITFAGSTSGTTTLAATATAGTTALTLPAATDTLVGKATTDTLTNKTFDTAGTGNNFSIAGVAVTANTGTGAVVRASSPTLTTPNLGTPSALTLTNAIGLPISGITGLGTGVDTWLATPSSANLASAVTGETGSGALVFGTAPTFTTNFTLGSDTVSDLTGLGLAMSSGALGLDVSAATDEFCLTYESTGPAIAWQSCGGGGGGGSPGGTNGQIQWNNAGAFDGFTASGDATIDTTTGAVTIAANAVALTTDTTGNYAAGDAEAGAALTGDSATSFFSSGTLEAARLPAATTSAQGACELATEAETETGTDPDRCVTPAGVAAAIAAAPGGGMKFIAMGNVTSAAADDVVLGDTYESLFIRADCGDVFGSRTLSVAISDDGSTFGSAINISGAGNAALSTRDVRATISDTGVAATSKTVTPQSLIKNDVDTSPTVSVYSTTGTEASENGITHTIRLSVNNVSMTCVWEVWGAQ
jgi:hypothetical protein